ncbi:hypothetical protein C9I56_35060 [Paraburkholderia caribensis]|uniref:Tyr recombinase domain-containing protein n=2 Tax=Paraburkholderia TaxID=1822464 RepID=B2JXK0_PARP8|nr:hypothetical protein Bphy_7378 [Paraburkholderia phymatum STM815]PTB24228.1 hypothetical protein C9I56_35060 [Paraburkholderia caribensis]
MPTTGVKPAMISALRHQDRAIRVALVATLEQAPKVALWLQNAMLLALISGQALSTIGRWERASVKNGGAVVTRAKTGVSIAIPLELRMETINMSLGEIIARCKASCVVSKYLIRHLRGNVNAPKGSAIKLKTISEKFLPVRRLAGYTADGDPTFHEIRSLSKRLYLEEDGVDTKALLGHRTRCNGGPVRKLARA